MDISTPEGLGWLSVQGAWRFVLRNPYRHGSAEWHRWLSAREEAMGQRHGRYGELTLRDRQIDPVRFRYATDDGRAA